MGYILTNQDVMRQDEDFEGEDGSFRFSVLDALLKRIDEPTMQIASNGQVIVFDDKDPSELVYGIAVNDWNKRITVSFRGTATSTDKLTDAQVWMEKVKNPYYEATDNQEENIYIHNGFYGEFCSDIIMYNVAAARMRCWKVFIFESFLCFIHCRISFRRKGWEQDEIRIGSRSSHRSVRQLSRVQSVRYRS